MAQHIRNGHGALRPYLYGSLSMIDFVQQAFDAQISEKHDTDGGFHVEATIGDTPFVLEAGDSFPASVEITKASVYLYVPDVDDTYNRALAAGANSISPPQDKPYGERGCGIRDISGNTWWIATYLS